MTSSPPNNPVVSEATPSDTCTDTTTALTSLSPEATDGPEKKVRKAYTITKSRESWTEGEHDKFLEALQLFDRDWKKIEDFVGSKTVIQIRSHAQKYFLKVQKNGTLAHVPPPRPKRKAAHPYPQKASKNAQMSLHVSMASPNHISSAPEYPSWDDTPTMLDIAVSEVIPPEDELDTLCGGEGVFGLNGITNENSPSASGIGSSSRTVSESKDLRPPPQAPSMHGLPDFAEVYNFIGSVFDPDSKGRMKKLKEMDPINFETVLLLMRNLTVNLSNPDFEPSVSVKFNTTSMLVWLGRSGTLKLVAVTARDPWSRTQQALYLLDDFFLTTTFKCCLQLLSEETSVTN